MQFFTKLRTFFSNKKKIITFFIISILIFTSFISLHIMAKYIPIDKNSYTINRKGMNNPNRPVPPLFHLRDDGIFFIHPASRVDAKATFRFNANDKQLWHFSIQKGSKVGRILFTIKQNDLIIKKFTVDSKHDYKLTLKVKDGDSITVIGNHAGSIVGDWGNLKISSYVPYYQVKILLIPILWILFFLYLIDKGYVYIAFNTYFGFMLTLIAEKVTSPYLLFSDILTYTFYFFFFAFFFVLVYQELEKFKKYKIASILKLITTVVIYIIPTAFIAFYLIYKKPINWNILYAIYQTNFNEAIEFIKTFVPTYYLFILIFIIFILAYFFIRQENREKKKIERSLLIFLNIVFFGLILGEFFKNGIPVLIDKTYTEYNNQIDKLKAFQKERKASNTQFIATKKEKGEVYVVVIGESLNKYNMGIYGHFRNTTPRQLKEIKNDNLQKFNNAYANAGSTMQVLSFSLTEANQYNNKNFYNSLSFIDIFNKAGFDTYWLTTQGILGNNIVSVIANTSKHVVDLGNGINITMGISSYFDETTIKALKKSLLNNKDKNKLIVIHIFGSHYHYQDRYPKKFSKYKNTKPYIIGTNKGLILDDYSGYDNSVYYNDYVVSSLLDVVKNYKGASCFIYFSDHGEDIIRHHGHTSRIDSFTYGMVNIPLTAWMSPEYKSRYPKTYETFISHKNRLFSNDLIYETLIGLAHINTNHYNPKYDLSSPKYNLNPKEAMTLHGRLHYTDPKNFYYWREHNTKILKESSISNKLVINSADTVGKLNEAWQLGFRKFEINLKYLKDKKTFQIGNKKYDANGNLIDLLSYFKVQNIKKLFLNLVNISLNNVDNIINRLENINSKLNIKDKTILIIKEPNIAKIFRDRGWQVAINSKIDNSNADYLVIDKKDYNISKSNIGIFINSAFNLADINLEKKLKNMHFFNAKNINFLFINFKSSYDD